MLVDRGWQSDGHQRSLALHAVVASKIMANPRSVISRARSNLDKMPNRSGVYVDRWTKLLDGPIPTLITTMLSSSDYGVTLRSCSPFAGVLNPSELARVNRAYSKSANT